MVRRQPHPLGAAENERPTGAGRGKPAPTARRPEASQVRLSAVPAYIRQALRANREAAAHFADLAPSHRRRYVGWIDSAKRRETKLRRLQQALDLLAAGMKLGLK